MGAFTTSMTLAANIDDSVITLWNKGIVFASTPELVADQAANIREEIGAKTVRFVKYPNIAIPSALVDGEDPASVALSDSYTDLTPAEEGAVVTTSRLASLQSGGIVDTGATYLVGRNAGTTQDYRAITALEAFSTTRIYPNGKTAASQLEATDVLDRVFANRLYNKLARTNTPTLMDGMYIGIAHEDCLYDLRNDVGTGGWMDVSKYADPSSALRNEVGMYAGIRWLRSSNVTVTANSNGTVDSYKVNVLGFNALGKAVSQPVGLRITGPFDKLGRFVNIGWYGVFQYAVVDTANMVQGICASSVGDN